VRNFIQITIVLVTSTMILSSPSYGSWLCDLFGRGNGSHRVTVDDVLVQRDGEVLSLKARLPEERIQFFQKNKRLIRHWGFFSVYADPIFEWSTQGKTGAVTGAHPILGNVLVVFRPDHSVSLYFSGSHEQISRIKDSFERVVNGDVLSREFSWSTLPFPIGGPGFRFELAPGNSPSKNAEFMRQLLREIPT
jgi:hypothetical protein